MEIISPEKDIVNRQNNTALVEVYRKNKTRDLLLRFIQDGHGCPQSMGLDLAVILRSYYLLGSKSTNLTPTIKPVRDAGNLAAIIISILKNPEKADGMMIISSQDNYDADYKYEITISDDGSPFVTLLCYEQGKKLFEGTPEELVVYVNDYVCTEASCQRFSLKKQ